MQLPWYVTALAAALIWGIHYPLIDNALKKISLYSVLLLTVLPVVLLAPFYLQNLRQDITVFTGLDIQQQLSHETNHSGQEQVIPDFRIFPETPPAT